MKHFCVITNSGKDNGYETTNRICTYLRERGGTCQVLPAAKEIPAEDSGMLPFTGRKRKYTDVSVLEEDVECAIVLGGDGTIIEAARELAEYNIPIFGVNLGTLGFLAEIEKQDLEEALDRLLSDSPKIEERMLLAGRVDCLKKGEALGHALNDIVITRSGYSRIITVKIYINDELLDTYHGDGVIISTPTGSTAYNLSAGGPVISPAAEVIVVTPICPHSLTARSVVIAAGETVRVEIAPSKKSQTEEAIVTFDGNEGLELHTGDTVKIARAAETARLVKINKASFAQVLHGKIGDGR